MLRIKATIISLLIVLYLCPINVELYIDKPPIWIHAIYMLFHANLLHLICNCYALWFVLNDRILKPKVFILLLYMIAVISSLIVVNDTLIVGASAVVYAAVGINMHGNRSKAAWLIVSATIAIGYFMTNVSASIHLVAFVLGFIVMTIYHQLQGLVNDYRAINRGKQ